MKITPERLREREVWIQPVEGEAEKKGETKHMGLAFQVADVKKLLLAVERIIEKGNHMTFGPSPEDNYIINKTTGDKMMLQENGKGSYLIEVKFVGGKRTTIFADSGAEENVCPWEWGRDLFGTR